MLSHEEICRVQARVNDAYGKRYLAKHGKAYPVMKSVDGFKLSRVEEFESQWEKIVSKIGGPETE